MADQTRHTTFFRLLFLGCAVYAGLFAFTTYVVVRYYGVQKTPGWTVRAADTGWMVTGVAETGPAAGRIEPGDRLLAIDGDERRAVLGTYQWRNVDGGETYRVDLDRRGERISFELPMVVVPGRKLEPIFQFCGLIFFTCGMALAFLRPHDPQVRMIGVLSLCVALSTLEATLAAPRPFLVGWERTVHIAVVASGMWTFPMTYHFFSRFPLWQSPGPLWRTLQWLLYGACVLVFWPAWMLTHLALDISDGVTRVLAARPALFLAAAQVTGRAVYAYMVACLLLALVVTARNYRRLRDPDSRRRIRWVVAGLTVALIPYMGMTFAARVVNWIDDATFRFYLPISFLAMVCSPASIVAAVWKEQLFDIRVLVRRGLQYLLARAALRTLLALPVALLIFSIVSNPDRTVAEIVTKGSGWLNLVLIAAIAAALPLQQRLQGALDRRFFREAYQQEQVLMQLIDEVRQRDSLADIARLVSGRINSVLHPASLHIFYRAQERSNRFEGHSSSDSLASHQLSQQHTLLRMIDDAKALRTFPADFDSLPESERRWLEALDVQLIVPIAGTRDRLVGVLLLGARLSDEPYSATDRQLLQGIASQIGLVYENQHLQERVRLDADVRRDVLARLDERISLLKECPLCGLCYDSAAERCEQDGAELALTLPVERTLDGKYRLDRALGRGGFGAVYEASDLRLHRQVAAKVMMGSLFGDRTALRRFEREARAAARIDHRHITRVYDYGAVGSGGAFLIMELVAGRTWRAEQHRCGVIAPPRAAEWFRQLLDGLQFAHEMGIVHRDLKPENVMLLDKPGSGEELKIMDFGLAKVLDAGAGVTESVSVAGMAMGTLGYMAPEVLTGAVVDERADLFAVGVMAVETIVGARPFEGRTPHEIFLSLAQGEYHLPGTSAEIRALDAVIQGCLAKDPRDRYGSAAELAKDLVPALRRCAGFQAPLGVPADTPTRGEPTPGSPPRS